MKVTHRYVLFAVLILSLASSVGMAWTGFSMRRSLAAHLADNRHLEDSLSKAVDKKLISPDLADILGKKSEIDIKFEEGIAEQVHELPGAAIFNTIVTLWLGYMCLKRCPEWSRN